MSWFLKGDYYENCSCTNTCPCTWSSMSAPATNDYCRANLAFKVSEGEVNGINMSGLVFVIILDSPALMSDGGWKVGVVVNEGTTDEQMGALGEVMSGDIGGPGAMLKEHDWRDAGNGASSSFNRCQRQRLSYHDWTIV